MIRQSKWNAQMVAAGMVVVNLLFLGAGVHDESGKVYANDESLLAETFDATEGGGYPASFDALTPKTAYTATVEEVAGAAGKSLVLERHASNTADSFYASATWTEDANQVAVTLKARPEQTNMIAFAPILRSENGGPIAQVSFYSDGRIRVFNNGTWMSAEGNLQAYEEGEWYEIKLVADISSQTFDVYIDGVPAGSSFEFQTSQQSVSAVQFGLYKGSTVGSLAVDDVTVYKTLSE